MFAYTLRRLLLAVPLLLGITFISFMVIHLAPGDPVEVQSGDMTERNIREAYKAPARDVRPRPAAARAVLELAQPHRAPRLDASPGPLSGGIFLLTWRILQSIFSPVSFQAVYKYIFKPRSRNSINPVHC